MIEKSFGFRKSDVVYKERIGAYGVGFDSNGKIPVVMTHIRNGETAYFLLGGGVENNEEQTDCVIRECIEEGGLSVKPKDFVCKGDFFQFIEKIKLDFHAIGYFYYMEINGIVAEPTEPDHFLVWLTINEAKEKLFLPHQIWAVEEIYKKYVK